MPESPCGRSDCPIVDPSSIDRRTLHVANWPAGLELFRGARVEFGDSVFAPEGKGNGRFSPLPRRRHAYLAEQRSAALLESVLHEANGPNPRIYAAQLTNHVVLRLRLTGPVRLLDLRDDALAALGIAPVELTDASPLHYACTRTVAASLVNTKGTRGFLWTSRQGRMHAERNRDGLASEVLEHRRMDVAVLYTPDAEATIETIDSEPLAVDGTPTRFVQELANLLRIAIL
ncbi:MAG: RES domain-containing protein [Actinomycetia bacterium]|nr:RES domain-containing protein [Actinomycetes bacterium]